LCKIETGRRRTRKIERGGGGEEKDGKRRNDV